MGSRVLDGCDSHAVGTWPGTAGHERQRRPTNCAGRRPAAGDPSRDPSRRRCASRDTYPDAVFFARAAVDNHDTAALDDAVTVTVTVTVANDHADAIAGARDSIPGPDLEFAASRTTSDPTHRNGDECGTSDIGRGRIESSLAAFTDAQSVTHAHA